MRATPTGKCEGCIACGIPIVVDRGMAFNGGQLVLRMRRDSPNYPKSERGRSLVSEAPKHQFYVCNQEKELQTLFVNVCQVRYVSGYFVAIFLSESFFTSCDSACAVPPPQQRSPLHRPRVSRGPPGRRGRRRGVHILLRALLRGRPEGRRRRRRRPGWGRGIAPGDGGVTRPGEEGQVRGFFKKNHRLFDVCIIY